MKLYEAIDLHSNNNVTVLIDEQDQVVYQKRLPNDLPLIVQQLSGRLGQDCVLCYCNRAGAAGVNSCHAISVHKSAVVARSLSLQTLLVRSTIC
jgi:hypothetical protein